MKSEEIPVKIGTNQSEARKFPGKSPKTSQKWGNLREIPDLGDLYTRRNYFLKQRVYAAYIRVIFLLQLLFLGILGAA